MIGVVVAGLVAMVVWALVGSEPALALQVRVVPSAVRLTPATNVNRYPRRIRMRAARGEVEGAQLVIDVKRAQRLRVAISNLRGSGGVQLDAKLATVYLERALTVRRASPSGRRGRYYDPLLDLHGRWLSLPNRGRATLWVDLEVPRDATPGDYRGSVAIERRSGVVLRVPVTLVVESATLPVRPLLGSSVGVDASQVQRFERVRAGAGLGDKLDQYFALLARARLSTADPNMAIPTVQDASALATSVEGAALIVAFDRSGVASYRVPFYETYPYPQPLGRDRDRAIRYLRAAAALYRSRGWLSRSYVYTVDEPSGRDAAKVRGFHDLVKEADPDLRLLVTSEPRPVFDGAVDIWAANISARVRTADIARERAQGREYWWYPSISTFDPYPTLFIDDRRASPRALGWLAYRYGVQGLFYWSATHWHEVPDPWRRADTYHDPGDGSVGNGDGSLVYPGRPQGADAPMPSVRLLQLRDGMEDYDLCVLAARAGGGSEIGAAVNALAPSLTRFSSSPTLVERLRATAFAHLA